MRRPEAFAGLERALEALPAAPKRVLDLGTGTGLAAFVAARRFPEAEVVGVDLAPAMVEQARQRTPPSWPSASASSRPTRRGSRSRTARSTSSSSPNMIPFFDELARVTAPGGHVVVLVLGRPGDADLGAAGAPPRASSGARGFADFADFEAEPRHGAPCPQGRSPLGSRATRTFAAR